MEDTAMASSIFLVDMRCHAEQREASPRHGRLYVMLSEVEASPRWLCAIHAVACRL